MPIAFLCSRIYSVRSGPALPINGDRHRLQDIIQLKWLQEGGIARVREILGDVRQNRDTDQGNIAGVHICPKGGDKLKTCCRSIKNGIQHNDVRLELLYLSRAERAGGEGDGICFIAKQLRTILDAVDDAVVVVDASGSIVLQNRLYSEFFGHGVSTPAFMDAKGTTTFHVRTTGGAMGHYEAMGRPVAMVNVPRLGVVTILPLPEPEAWEDVPEAPVNG